LIITVVVVVVYKAKVIQTATTTTLRVILSGPDSYSSIAVSVVMGPSKVDFL